MQENGFCQDTGMEVRVLGDMSMAPPNLQEAAARVMAHSAQLKNKQGVLNICFAYTWVFQWQGSQSCHSSEVWCAAHCHCNFCVTPNHRRLL